MLGWRWGCFAKLGWETFGKSVSKSSKRNYEYKLTFDIFRLSALAAIAQRRSHLKVLSLR